MAGLPNGFLALYIATITPVGTTIATAALLISLLLGSFLRTGSGLDVAYWLLALALNAPSLMFLVQFAGAPANTSIGDFDLSLSFLVFFFFGPFGLGWLVGCFLALLVRLGLRTARTT